MIPPLLMDIRPGMTVLDLCAAPGSKSAQLIEMVHGGEEARTRKILQKIKQEDGREVSPDGTSIQQELGEEGDKGEWSDDGRTTGLLIANDVDYRRAHMLIHQMKRLNSPNLIVTNHDATFYPSIKIPSDGEGANAKGKYLKFDRILADVPCSGDGTCRKNINVWRDWNPVNAMGLFPTQVRVLVRALQMLKTGGRVVYSTCSMNPIENEAVIACAIDRCGGSNKVNIVDCRSALPELKRKSGLKTWKVMDKQGRMWSSWQDVEKVKEEEGVEGFGKVAEGMFPPEDSSKVEGIPLERCMRVYSHLQDTGGFFIAVLEKKSEIKARPEEGIKAAGKEPVKNEPKSSILSVVDEIEAQSTNGTNLVEHIWALDDIAPPHLNDGEVENASAAARQNQENAPTESISNRKRELDDIADAEMSVKRPKFRDEIDEPAPRGMEDRQVHYPPPPGAELDLTRPEAAEISQPATVASNFTKKRNDQPFEEPFKYLAADHEELESIYNFYHLHPRFPRDRFMVRNASGNPVKTIYYTSALARSILTENEGKGIKFVHCGVKMFVKQDVQKEGVCRWRIQTDGLPILESWIGEERVVRLRSRKTLRGLLVEMFPKVDGQGWKELGEIGERVKDISMGCCILRVETSEGEDGFRYVKNDMSYRCWTRLIRSSEQMVLPLWRSLHSLNLMLPKEERKAMLLRLYNDDSPLMDHSKDRFLGKTNGSDEPEERTKTDDALDYEMKVENEEEGESDSEAGGVRLDAGTDIEMDVKTEALQDLAH